MDDFRHIVHVNVHVDQLLQIEVYLPFLKTKHAIPDVSLNSWLLRIEKVRHCVRHVKKFGLEQAQQPGLWTAATAATSFRCSYSQASDRVPEKVKRSIQLLRYCIHNFIVSKGRTCLLN